MVELAALLGLVGAEHGLSVVSIGRADGTVSTSVVNAGVLTHPVSGLDVVGFVVRGDSFKRRRLLIDPRVTITIRVGWEWQAVEGSAELIGPNDPCSAGSVDVSTLLRDIFVSAGGTHDDWATYDRVMAEEGRTAVLVAPRRAYGNVGR